MKKALFILSIVMLNLFQHQSVKAQYVTIPDANFVAYLQANFPSCMSGNQMDTTCIHSYLGVIVDVSNLNIADLTGIQYFLLSTLNCRNNNLSSIPPLGPFLFTLYCDHNNLTTLPSFFNNNLTLTASYNQLTSLPFFGQFPDTLIINNNNIECFPSFPSNMSAIDISSNPNTCVPNHIPCMDAATMAMPICVFGDTINNPSGCATFEEITGHTYKDNNSNCIYDAGDAGRANVNLKLYDNTGNYVAQTNSYANGMYSFVVPGGTYNVVMDILGAPYAPTCAYPGNDSVVIFSLSVNNVNFNLACQGFDVGCQYVFPHGSVFPGMLHDTHIGAGDMSQWYGFSCASGIGGTVQVTYSGPVTYVSPYYSALIPIVTGNILTYTVADFGAVNSWDKFAMVFLTDTSATIGDQVCLTVDVIPSVSGDINTYNNTYTHCYNVYNSYDPNNKEVYPKQVPPLYDDYLTYTIHFQNTGTAAAHNVKVVDTLSSLLDVSTFKEINHSHADVISFNGHVATFNFPNINLIDSTSNDTASIGYIQYKIKPVAGITSGTHIDNRASIYFDYNPPILTPTATTIFGNVGIIENNLENTISIAPNPFTSQTTITSAKYQIQSIKITDVLGKVIQQQTTNNKQLTLDMSGYEKGIYFVQITDENKNVVNRKIIVQ